MDQWTHCKEIFAFYKKVVPCNSNQRIPAKEPFLKRITAEKFLSSLELTFTMILIDYKFTIMYPLPQWEVWCVAETIFSLENSDSPNKPEIWAGHWKKHWPIHSCSPFNHSLLFHLYSYFQLLMIMLSARRRLRRAGQWSLFAGR